MLKITTIQWPTWQDSRNEKLRNFQALETEEIKEKFL
eukprot:gene8471-5947_t